MNSATMTSLRQWIAGCSYVTVSVIQKSAIKENYTLKELTLRRYDVGEGQDEGHNQKKVGYESLLAEEGRIVVHLQEVAVKHGHLYDLN